jgi:hypothetical protein
VPRGKVFDIDTHFLGGRRISAHSRVVSARRKFVVGCATCSTTSRAVGRRRPATGLKRRRGLRQSLGMGAAASSLHGEHGRLTRPTHLASGSEPSASKGVSEGQGSIEPRAPGRSHPLRGRLLHRGPCRGVCDKRDLVLAKTGYRGGGSMPKIRHPAFNHRAHGPRQPARWRARVRPLSAASPRHAAGRLPTKPLRRSIGPTGEV